MNASPQSPPPRLFAARLPGAPSRPTQPPPPSGPAA